jgi:hypothetical protein
MIRSFAAAILWVVALWSLGGWLEAILGVPTEFGLLAGVVVGGLLIGHGLRLKFPHTTAGSLPETVTAE